MKINLDHFETIEELEKDLISWIKEEDIYSFDRYLNKEDVLTIVQLLIKKENIIKEVREYCMKYENWEDDCVNDIMKILDKANDREDK